MKRLKLLVLSDLHLEFAPFMPDPAAVDAADVVVLAGDICNGTKAIPWARQAFGSKPVVYVAGNHEFYRFDWIKLLDQMREQSRLHGVHFLENHGDSPLHALEYRIHRQRAINAGQRQRAGLGLVGRQPRARLCQGEHLHMALRRINKHVLAQ